MFKHAQIKKAVALVTTAVSGTFVAATALAGVALAAPESLPDSEFWTVTDDGYTLRVKLTETVVNAVPNLATTAFTREGFYSTKVTATIEGEGAANINAAALLLELQQGVRLTYLPDCNWELPSTLALPLPTR